MAQPTEQSLGVTIETTTAESEIIIIDDDPGFSFMLKDYLYSNGNWKAELFTNGNDFLKNYHSNDSRKIILDYEFDEGPSGLVTLKQIKERNPMAVVIMVSGQDDLERAVETLRKGATDYFVKTNKTVFANIVCSLKKLHEMEKNKWN